MLVESVKHLTVWLHNNPHWGGVLAFVVAFTESLAIIGAIVPGSVTLTAIGALVGSMVIPAGSTIIAAIIGAIVGDVLSYGIGYYYHEHLRVMWPFYKHPQLLTRGEDFFRKHGGKSIFIGRFVGPVRSILPLVAGIVRMPKGQFIFADIVSAIFWAPAYMLPGILIGAASLELSPDDATRFILLVLLSLLLITIITWLLRFIFKWKINKLNQLLQISWQYFRAHKQLRWVTILFCDPAQPDGHGQLGRLCGALFTGICFLILMWNVIHAGLLTQWNYSLYHLLQSFRTTQIDRFAIVSTLFAERYVLLPVWLIMTAWLAIKKHWWTALHSFANGFLVTGGLFVLKHLVDNPRPAASIANHPTSSFPSGHTALAFAVVGFLTLIITKNLDREKRHYVYWGSGIFVGLIGFTRLYLGAHWLTDIVGAFLMSATCLLLTSLSYHRRKLPEVSTLGFTAVTLVSLMILGVSQNVRFYSHAKHRYAIQKESHNLNYQTWWDQAAPLLPLRIQNRVGKPTLLLNIQFAGKRSVLEEALTKMGWKNVADDNFFMRLNRIAAKNHAHQLPFFNTLYQNEKPLLVMKKMTNKTKPILIMRLWPSGYQFRDKQTALWIGMVHHRVLWHHHWLTERYQDPDLLPTALSKLNGILPQFKWRKIKLYDKTNDKEVRVLLLRE